MFRHGVGGLNLAHNRKLVAVDLSSEVTGDSRPRIAAVIGTIELIGGDVQPGV